MFTTLQLLGLVALSMGLYGVLSIHGYIVLRRRHEEERQRRIAKLVASAAALVIRKRGIWA